MNNLCSYSLNDLINGIDGENKICFVVPSYQRGYRWTSNHIKRLLLDLYEFGIEREKNNPNVGNYYCLQPIIVKKIITNSEISKKLGDKYSIKNDVNYYEIVDGQQRMITIFILLKYLLIDSEPFSIEFERDRGKDKNKQRHKLLNSFCFGFDTESVCSDSADVYYFLEAFKSIKTWFNEDKTSPGKSNLRSFMENVIRKKAMVIWYEVDNKSDCYTIFKNINHGKIPLTDAELVKSILLNSKYYSKDNNKKQDQERYARLWDEIQKALNDEGMWSFITGGGNIELPTNIDFLIQLIVTKENSSYLDNSDYKYFSYFENKLAESENKKIYVESVFELLKNTFRTIQDWYNNYSLHNYIGYILTYSGKDVSKRIKEIIDLLKKNEKMSKVEFSEELKNRIKDKFDNLTIDDINYEDNRKDIEKLLMLFNIEELNKIHSKFNFNVDKDGWSIEHIKAQHSDIVQADKRRKYLEKEKESLNEMDKSICDNNLKNEIKIIISEIDNLLKDSDIEENKFKEITEKIDKKIDDFEEVDMHRLGNLALLSKRDNSELSNNPFYIKRDLVNQWLNDSTKNIPNSTRKAFLKMYSQQDYTLDFTRWKKSDFNDMFKRQKEMLRDYIRGC